ncbi:MAG: hypothetical protein JF597_19675 [Streptomyces sp.]|nr:hypothetical protein [Streptomyces sp.]
MAVRRLDHPEPVGGRDQRRRLRLLRRGTETVRVHAVHQGAGRDPAEGGAHPGR